MRSLHHSSKISLPFPQHQNLLFKLIGILQGDREGAMRLISQVKIKNPGKSVDWCVEKVIYDLERVKRLRSMVSEARHSYRVSESRQVN